MVYSDNAAEALAKSAESSSLVIVLIKRTKNLAWRASYSSLSLRFIISFLPWCPRLTVRLLFIHNLSRNLVSRWCLTLFLLSYKTRGKLSRCMHRHSRLNISPWFSPGEEINSDWDVDAGKWFRQIHQLANILPLKIRPTWELFERENGLGAVRLLTLHRREVLSTVFLRRKTFALCFKR